MKAFLVALLLGSCVSAHVPPPVAPEPAIALDTTVLILRVLNRQPFPIRVYLHALNQPRRRVSALDAGHDGFFVIPSSEARQVLYFYITAESDDVTRSAYRSVLLWRNPTKVTIVILVVGPVIRADSVRGPQS